MFKRCFAGFLKTFYAPRGLYQAISQGQRYDSWLCVLSYSLFYVGGSLWLYFKGYTPFVTPWLKIPESSYYLVQSVYILPLVFAMWILATGILMGVSRFFGGQARDTVLFRMTGYSLWAPWYLLIIVDCIHATPEWLYNTVLFICMILILRGTALATKIETRTSSFGAVVAALLALVVTGLILFTYIR